MGDISDVERKDKTSHLRNIIVSANSNLPYNFAPNKHSPTQQNSQSKVVRFHLQILNDDVMLETPVRGSKMMPRPMANSQFAKWQLANNNLAWWQLVDS